MAHASRSISIMIVHAYVHARARVRDVAIVRTIAKLKPIWHVRSMCINTYMAARGTCAHES